MGEKSKSEYPARYSKSADYSRAEKYFPLFQRMMRLDVALYTR